MPAILQAATDAPTPEPQTRMPRSASSVVDRLAELARLVGIVDPQRVGVRAEVDDLGGRPPSSVSRIVVAQMHAAVVERDGDVHPVTPRASRSASARATTLSTV